MNEERGKECLEVSKWYNILGHSAPVPSSTCEHVQSCVPNEKSGVSEQLRVQIAACAHTCCLGQVQSGPVYYTAWRLPNTLFLHLLVLIHQRVNYMNSVQNHTLARKKEAMLLWKSSKRSSIQNLTKAWVKRVENLPGSMQGATSP